MAVSDDGSGGNDNHPHPLITVPTIIALSSFHCHHTTNYYCIIFATITNTTPLAKKESPLARWRWCDNKVGNATTTTIHCHHGHSSPPRHSCHKFDVTMPSPPRHFQHASSQHASIHGVYLPLLLPQPYKFGV